jgi:hypothetical protein
MEINLNNLHPDEFEKLAFYLLDDMGFKNLEWRKGGEGVSATDGGRDLSGKYAKVEPDDSIIIENWWIEVKHRSDTLKKSTVQNIILNATARKDVDVFAIFTNNVISNPTLDWIKEFQNTHAKPRIVVWQGHDVERILRKYPRTIAMFFPESLSLPEQLESVKERFWNKLGYPTIDEVEQLWKNFDSLIWDGSKLLPVIIADSAIDGLSIRKWGLVIDDNLLTETFLLGFINLPLLTIRFEEQGHKREILQQGLEYLLQIVLFRFDLDKVVELLVNMFDYTEFSEKPPPELINLVINPVVSNVFTSLLRNCTLDCERFRFNWAKSNKIDQAESHYFHKFSANLKQEQDDTEPFVFINSNIEKCKLELVPTGVFCPLTVDIPENIMDRLVLKEFLGTIQNVIKRRVEYVADS